MTVAPILVTAVFDFTCERRHLPAVLSIDCPMSVYTDAAHEPLVRELRGERPTRVQVVELAALERHELYAPLQRIRTDAAWLAQAAWLPESPQARLPACLPSALSKPLWLYQQAQANPFSGTHFYWVDADLGRTAAPELLRAESFVRLAQRHARFLLVCRPHEPDSALHGFDAAALARLAGVERTRWAACCALFGGAAAAVSEVGARYSQHLERTLELGLLGNEESLLTLQSYAEAEFFDLQFVDRGSDLGPFLTQLAAGWPGELDAARRRLEDLAETWFLSFHAPLQLQRLLESIEAAEPALLRTARRVLVNSSTNPAVFAAYDALCARYGLEQIREGNRGMNGARDHAAGLFRRGGRHAMFWFEDDMLLVRGTDPAGACENGLPRHVHGVAGAALGILQREFADYVKLSFTESSGAHHTQLAWKGLEQNVREYYFPGSIDPPPEAVAAIRSFAHVSYAVGEAAYSNWPHLVTRRGTQKLFFEERQEPCAEQYWAARSFEMLRQGRLRAAVLLASPVEHRRTQAYSPLERVDYAHLEGESVGAAPVAAPVALRAREWPARPGAIFVAIANYRDSETTHTLRDLFAKAADPARVYAGVFSQVVPGTDDDCLPDALPHGAPEGHVRELRVHASESLGACWARSRVFAELLQGEEYVLQIDSHSRFEIHWDERLLHMYGCCPSPRALLTTYPPSYTLPDERSAAISSSIAANYFDDTGIMVAKSRVFDPLKLPRTPAPGAFVSAGFLFGPATAFREVPYDPHLYFHGEEPSLAVRFWTHGWDFYAPHQTVLYHDYSSDRGRPRNWEDRHDWVALNARSVARLRHLFGIEESRDPAVLREIGRYGLGTARSLREYEEFADLGFADQRIGPRAADGYFPASPQDASLAMQRAARERYLEGLTTRDAPAQETRSGGAATLAATAVLRPLLEEWLRDRRIRSLVDAGCGDFNWMQAVDLSGLALYAGYDIVPELVARNQQLYGARRGHFFAVADIARTPLAACDAILCRRVLCEMPEEEALRALANFRASGARYLLASTRVAPGKDSPRPVIDLLAAPYGLALPLTLLLDADGAALGVWSLAAD